MHLPDVAASQVRWFDHLRQTLMRHRLLAAIVLVYATVSLALSLSIGDRVETDKFTHLGRSFMRMVPQMVAVLLIWRLLHMRYRVPGPQQWAWLRADLRAAVTNRERLLSGLVAAVLMLVVLISFAQLKRLIPVIQPFSWDLTFVALDQALHFGTDPWRLAHAIAGAPLVVTFFTGCYNLWLFLMYFSLVFACFSLANRSARMRYLIAFILTWAIGGNLIATLFSSAGPVYVQRLGLGDHFAPLMAVLKAHAAVQPISVVETQNLLWDWYSAPQSLNGISAFPSMHVASTVLMALYARAYHPRLGRVMSVFAGIILLGSVLLGWHYAVDGYVGALIAFTCWWGVGRLLRGRFA